MTSFKDIDRGYDRIKKQLFRRGTSRLVVGILAPEGQKDRGGVTNAQLGAIHEFGAPRANIPERSFLRRTFDERQAEYERSLRSAIGKVVDRGGSLRLALERLGARAAADVQNTIARGIPPPNAPRTVAKKGSSTPLIDTGQLRQSISYDVEERR